MNRGARKLKQKLRIDAKELLQTINPSEKEQMAQSLYTQLIQTNLWKEAHVIGITNATALEWDTMRIVEKGWIDNKIIVMPKVNHLQHTMQFYQIESMHELEKGYGNILEPKLTEGQNWNEKIDLLVVPGLLFDKRGYRLGFGGGFYDRYLAQHDPVTISLVATYQLVTELPIDAYDVPVDYMITEHGCLRRED